MEAVGCKQWDVEWDVNSGMEAVDGSSGMWQWDAVGWAVGCKQWDGSSGMKQWDEAVGAVGWKQLT